MSYSRRPRQSTQFRELEVNLRKIEKYVLPKEKIDGSYTEKERMLVRSYRMLAHAEFEFYFEEVAKLTIIQAHNKWKQKRTASNILTVLASFTNTTHEIPEAAFNREGKINNGASCHERLSSARKNYFDILKRNNGIREKNLLKIFLPIGLSIDEIDNTWLNTIESFGVKRGTVAHNSIKVQNIIDPKTESKDVNDILNGIRELDYKICCLK